MAQVGNQVTRLTIDGKENGKALNNDGPHLVRFYTSGQWMVQDLGMVSDAAANGGNSVHNPCLSWGGDISADVLGKLVPGNRKPCRFLYRRGQSGSELEGIDQGAAQ